MPPHLANGVYQLGEGASCLITAGAGGVGLILTQMAKALGATVYTVVSTDQDDPEDRLKELGLI